MRTKIFDSSELIQHLEEQRSSLQPRLRFVFTDGCFDLVHIGHVRFLYEARRLGDGLIAALYDDGVVRRLKGGDRPILKLQERMQVVAGLGCVDYVVALSGDSPIELIQSLRPEIVAVSDDHDAGALGAVAAEWGGEVQPIPETEGVSATRLIAKVAELRKG